VLPAVADLDESFEAVVVLDSDTVPHATWLRELVSPFNDPEVGVASGNRWYMPDHPTMGALVRYIWNAAAVVQMYWNRFTWGGSVAIRAEVVRSQQLQDRWRNAVAEDTAIYGVVRQRGLRAAFVPSLMIVNREVCSVREFCSWMKRQLLVGRLQHEGWPVVLAHGLATSALLLISVALTIVAVFLDHWQAATVVGSGLFFYATAMIGVLMAMETAVRRIARARGERTGWLTPAAMAKFIVAIPLTQLLYALALTAVGAMKKLTWRGVEYQVDGPWQVRLVRYQPYKPTTTAGQSII
jgi:hypothetical protein